MNRDISVETAMLEAIFEINKQNEGIKPIPSFEELYPELKGFNKISSEKRLMELEYKRNNVIIIAVSIIVLFIITAFYSWSLQGAAFTVIEIAFIIICGGGGMGLFVIPFILPLICECNKEIEDIKHNIENYYSLRKLYNNLNCESYKPDRRVFM